MVGGQLLYGRVKIRMEPQEIDGRPVIVLNHASMEEMPGEFAAAVIDELTNSGAGGGLIMSAPLMNLKVTILEMESRDDSTEVAFRFESGNVLCCSRAVRSSSAGVETEVEQP